MRGHALFVFKIREGGCPGFLGDECNQNETAHICSCLCCIYRLGVRAREKGNVFVREILLECPIKLARAKAGEAKRK